MNFIWKILNGIGIGTTIVSTVYCTLHIVANKYATDDNNNNRWLKNIKKKKREQNDEFNMNEPKGIQTDRC